MYVFVDNVVHFSSISGLTSVSLRPRPQVPHFSAINDLGSRAFYRIKDHF